MFSYLGLLALPVLLLSLGQSRLILSYFQAPNVRFFYHTGSRNDLALTFDDGPHPNSTPALLAVLRKHNIRATFFLIGLQVKQHPELVAEIVRDGHQIENHDYLDRCSYLHKSNLKESVEKTEELLRQIRGYRGQRLYFRPGSGFYDSEMLSIISHKISKVILGDVYSHDVLSNSRWLGFFGRLWTEYFLYTQIRAGSIIVLHDKPGLQTVAVLDQLLPKLSDYKFKTITEMEQLYPDL